LKNGITLVEGDAINAKWVASQIAVSTAIKHTNATKIITFHSRVKTAREFASDKVYGIKKFVNDFEVFHVHGKQKSNERKDTISKFRKINRSIITNAKCLTEGVDVPAVDMVVFVDPRHSKIDIAQAVGRAMRKPRGGDKTVGYIVVPIFAEDTSEHSVEEAIKSEKFDDVALVLNALLEQDEELAEIVQESKQAKGQGKVFNPQRFKEKIEVIGPLIGLDELTNSIYAETVDRLGESWDERLGRLIGFKEREGHCRVPARHIENGFNLGIWVNNHRSQKNTLPIDRINRLNQLGFVWDYLNEIWEKMFSTLVAYKNREGHVNILRDYSEDGLNLGIWIANQRRTKDKLSADKIERLDELGFIWNRLDDKWEEGFSALKNFKEREGHINVSRNHKIDGFNLGFWVHNQRKKFDKLSTHNRKRLDELGFIWNRLDDKWEEGFSALKNFKEREGHCKVPSTYTENNFNLGKWVSHQRTIHNELSVDRLFQLNSLGFLWAPILDRWEKGYSSLKSFQEREGHCRVPSRFNENGFNLGIWVSHQRSNIDNISIERLDRLNALGFIWKQFEQQWDDGFSALITFQQREGHCKVPHRHLENGFNLGIWIANQRRNKDNLSEDRLNRLNSLGFLNS
jgi:hypothetical protein